MFLLQHALWEVAGSENAENSIYNYDEMLLIYDADAPVRGCVTIRCLQMYSGTDGRLFTMVPVQ